MRIIRQLSFSLASIIFFALPLFAAEFTADSKVVSGGQTKQTVFYFSSGKWRVNENAPEGKRAIIFREDNKTLVILWPDKKLYLTQSVPSQQYTMLAKLQPGEEVERTEIGRETVSGYQAIKYRVRYRIQDRQFTYIELYSKELGVVLKSHTEDNSERAELTNIKKIKLDKKIFEVPSDYRPATKNDLAEMNPQAPAR